ncbi:MAG: glycosyltransferase family 4 protein [Bacteroidota bacterium]
MKILLIPENFPTDENPVAGIFMKDYLKAMTPFSEVTMLNSNPWYRDIYEEVAGVKSYDLHFFSRKWKFPFNILAYTWWERQSFNFAKKLPKPDLIHLHGAAQRGKWALQLAKFWKVPLVITEHTGPWSAISLRPALLARVKKIMEQADLIMPVSHHLKKEILESGIHPSRIEVLGNPVDTEFFCLREKPLDQKRILFLGRLDPFKGGLRTMKAFVNISAEFPDYKLTIAGRGIESEAIQNCISKNGLESKVDFIEKQLTREEMRDLFYKHSFLVFPSEFESFGLVAAEAMSTGLPVLITNQTGPRDFSKDENSVQIDPKSLVEGFKMMVKRKSQFKPKFVRDSIEEKYGVENWANSIRKLFESLL